MCSRGFSRRPRHVALGGYFSSLQRPEVAGGFLAGRRCEAHPAFKPAELEEQAGRLPDQGEVGRGVSGGVGQAGLIIAPEDDLRGWWELPTPDAAVG